MRNGYVTSRPLYWPAETALTAPPVGAVDHIAVNRLVRLAAYLFVASIPFELPQRSFPIEIPTLTGFILLASALTTPGVAFRKIPGALLWFGLYFWVLVVSAIVNHADAMTEQVYRLFVAEAQLMLIFWVLFNILGDARVMRGVLLAIVVAFAARAIIQIAGIGVTSYDVWTGGARVTALGQNVNLSALILSVGLVAVVGHHAARADGLLMRLGLITLPLVVLFGAAVVQTGSRGGMLAAAAGLLAFSFSGRSFSARVRNGLLSTLAVVIFGWAALSSSMVRARFEESANEGHLAGRERIYPALVDLFVERPILGWGPIANQVQVARRIEDPAREQRDAHNLVLEVFTTTGVLGGIPFFIAIALCVRGAWRARRGAVGALPLAALLVLLVGTISGTWIASKILWLTLAIALAAGWHWGSRSPPVQPGDSN